MKREWSTLRKLMFIHATGGSLSELTETGNPLSFETNVAKPLRAFSMSMLPTQEGTGDPYPPGGGKNLFDLFEYGYFSPSQNKFMTSTTNATSKPVWMAQGTVVTISQSNMSNDYSFEEWSIEITSTSQMKSANLLARASNATGAGRTYTVQNDCYLTVRMGIVDQTLEQAQLMFEKGSSASPYQPYSNIRPITGWTGVSATRTGKNLFDVAHATIISGYMTSAPKIIASDYAKIFVVPCKGSTSYTITRKNATSRFTAGTTATLYTSGSFDLIDYRSDGNEGNSLKELHITTSATAKYLYVWYYRSQSDSDYDATLAEMMVEEGSTASTYEAYNGQTVSVTFPALGKNLFNGTRNDGYISDSGVIGTDSSNAYSDLIPVEQGETYTYSVYSATNVTRNRRIHGYNSSGTWVEMIDKNIQSGTGIKSATFTVPNGISFIRVQFGKNPENEYDIQVEKGSSPTAYEPYNSTVYGGSLNLTTGVLTVTKCGFYPQYCTDIVASGSTETTTTFQIVLARNNLPGKKDNDVISNIFSKNISSGKPGRLAATTTSIYFIIATDQLDSADLTGVVKWLKENGAFILYNLETNQTYQLTPQQVQTLIGTNTVWSNANGDCSVTYLKKG